MIQGSTTLLLLTCFCLLVSPALAFGAGEVNDDNGWDGYVWRHGDIEKVLMCLPISFTSKYAFTKMQAQQVYFGNWLRDYSQLLDISLLQKAHESVLRGIVSVLGFMEFKLATDEFDVTPERLGVYRHEHHIDNPFGYAKDLPGQDASKIDSRLRGPVRSEELEIDPVTGMKNYIANSGKGWSTSAAYVKEQLQKCIQKGRDQDMKEALIHLGAAMHTLEDFAAHSNYTELVLRELGVDSVFPFVGDGCKVQVPGTDKWVAPITTGTFGALDILHSFLGEVEDNLFLLEDGSQKKIGGPANVKWLDNKLRTTGRGVGILYTEIRDSAKLLGQLCGKGQELFAQLDRIELGDLPTSIDLDKLDANGKPTVPFDIWPVIQPVLRVHDIVEKFFLENEDLLKLPWLDKMIEKIRTQVDEFVYSFLAQIPDPFLGQAEEAAQLAADAISRAGPMSSIFDEGSTDSNPSHTDIAKDHFSNLLNQPAGLVATVITNWSVQQVVRCWDDKDKDADATIDSILTILHHPAFPQTKTDPQKHMFQAVKTWWEAHNHHQRKALRKRLSKANAIAYHGGHAHKAKASDFTSSTIDMRHRQGFCFEGSHPETTKRPTSLTEKLEAEAKELIEKISRQLDETEARLLAAVRNTPAWKMVVSEAQAFPYTCVDIRNGQPVWADEAGNIVDVKKRITAPKEGEPVDRNVYSWPW